MRRDSNAQIRQTYHQNQESIGINHLFNGERMDLEKALELMSMYGKSDNWKLVFTLGIKQRVAGERRRDEVKRRVWKRGMERKKKIKVVKWKRKKKEEKTGQVNEENENKTGSEWRKKGGRPGGGGGEVKVMNQKMTHVLRRQTNDKTYKGKIINYI